MTKDKALKLSLYGLEIGLPLIEDFGSTEQLNAQHKAIAAIYEALAQLEQKPMHPQLKAMLEEYFDKCFAESAPQRTWVGLTELEKAEITSLKWWDWEDTFDIEGFIQAIEAKLKEKNT